MRTADTKDGIAILCECGLCGREFQFGPHRYDGRRISAWDVMACDVCLKTNSDGVVPGR